MALIKNRARTLGFALVVLLLVALPLHAQTPDILQVLIQDVDTSGFPDVAVAVSVSDATGGRVADLGADSFQVLENGAPVEVEVGQKSVGTQTVFVIDASASMKGLGASGTQRLEEAKTAIRLFKDNYMQDGGDDWVMLLAPEGTEGVVSTVADWTRHRQGVENGLIEYEMPPGAYLTPLYNSVWEAVNRLKARPDYAHLHGSIVVFSDGFDDVSDVSAETAANHARENGVSVHTVLLSDAPSDEAVRNLRGLSRITSGQYVHYTSLDEVAPIFTAIAGHREQTVLHYTSQSAEKGERLLEVSVRSNVDAAFGDPAQLKFTVHLEDPQVNVGLPQGTEIMRQGDSPQAVATEIEPRTWPIEVQVAFPDGHHRELSRVECLVDNAVQTVVTAPPFEQIACDISTFSTGRHSLKVRVTDELGATGESTEQVLDIQVLIPTPVPTATPVPTPTNTPTPAPTPTATPTVIVKVFQDYGTLLALLLAVGALILGIFILLRRPRVAEAVKTTASTIASRVRAVTEPFFPGRARADKPQSKAYLVIIAGDLTHTGDIELVGENVRFGRDPALVTVAFEDRSVSRLHARISETEDGMFWIYDEGSTSGTFVNYEQVPAGGQLLQHDDVINLGRVQLQFKLRGVEEEKMGVTEAFQVSNIRRPTPPQGGTPTRVLPPDEQAGQGRPTQVLPPDQQAGQGRPTQVLPPDQQAGQGRPTQVLPPDQQADQGARTRRLPPDDPASQGRKTRRLDSDEPQDGGRPTRRIDPNQKS